MSILTLCDSCKKIIYEEKDLVQINVQVVKNRYQSLSYPVHKIDICQGCDLKLAKCLLPVLPNIAGEIEPNVYSLKKEEESSGD
jgi:hypothetical protein